MVEEVENGKSTANPAVLLYRPQDLTVELRQPSYFDHTEIRKFSPIILRAVKVPLRDSGGEVKLGGVGACNLLCEVKIEIPVAPLLTFMLSKPVVQVLISIFILSSLLLLNSGTAFLPLFFLLPKT